METYDPQKAARVWQRVQAGTPAGTDAQSLLSLIAEEWTDAATYLSLSRRYQGGIRNTLYRMFQEEQTHTACLKGIYTLITGAHPKVSAVPPSQEPAVVVLRRCYGREMRSLAQYEARGNDPEYGQVFLKLAAQEREHCKTILQLLGSIPTNGRTP